MQLHRAFQFAVILSWKDLQKIESPAAVRIEYQRQSDTPLDHVTVWLDKGGGYCDRVCDYWTWTSPAHPVAVQFCKGHDSDRLARALGFIMQNQEQFTAPATTRVGLVIIDPPGDDDCREAEAWAETALRSTTSRSSAEQLIA